MDLASILLIAGGLSIDALTVSICSGMTMKPVQAHLALRIAAFFGGFQALMPILGWLGGTGFQHLISAYDHWIAFGLLAFIGGKMVYESFRGEACERQVNPANLGVLLVLAVATSIDALAVGLSFALLDVAIVRPAVIIGIVTLVISFAGVYLGKRCSGLFQSRVETAGGLILLGIGVKILVEHLSSGVIPIA